MDIAESERTRDEGEADHELLASDVPSPVDWILLTGPRWAVAGGLLLLYLGVLLVLLDLGLIATANGSFLSRLFASLIASNVMFITLVITINQLLISREFSAAGQLRDDIRQTIEFRQDVAGLIDSRSAPTSPAAFLTFLVVILRDEAAALRDETRTPSGDSETALSSLTGHILTQAEAIRRTVGDPSKDPFEALLVVLNADFSTDFHDAQQLKATQAHSLSPDVESKLTQVIEILEHIGVARQYMKTLYFQRTLTALSREILYVGIPALGLQVVSILVLSGASGPTIDGPALNALVIGAVVVAVTPVALFAAYVLRLATISRRTGAVLPFDVAD